MDRRHLLIGGATTLAAASLARGVLAQAAGAVSAKLKIDAYSRHLLWLATPEDVAQACIEMGYDGLDITVRAPSQNGQRMGHVDPANVKDDLPKFVNVIRRAGLIVDTVTTNISDADSPNAEAILDTASQLGIKHYWWGTYRYDVAKPILPQIDALKPRVEKLSKLNEKYGMKAMYHNYSGGRTVGDSIFDFLNVLENFDPRWVSFHYDTGHATESAPGDTWSLAMRAAGPYIGGISFKDSYYKLGADGPEEGAGGAPGAAAEGGRRGGGGGRGAGNAAGPDPRGGGSTNPWHIVSCPLGMGMVDLPLVAQVMKEINFQGPVEIQAEYPNGGANNAGNTITLPRAQVLGAMRRDLLTLKAVLGPAGLI